MIQLTDEISDTLRSGGAIVALESTIIAHGMPFPQNLEMAESVENAVRKAGAIPATIAILKGQLCAGLDANSLERFARDGASIPKASIRDLPYLIAKKSDGATTVASTMRIAALAGISVFATGGIGGVHRGGSDTLDISNDLDEFAASNVAVVTAGAKAILDLPLTLEYLETRGVPVIGYGTQEFPAFYSRKSGLELGMFANGPGEVASIMRAKWQLGLNGGVVVANPIPAEFEIPVEVISPFIEAALLEAKAKAIAGKHVTPFLLSQLANITGGKSLSANIALVLNNARVAAEIAVAYAAEKRSGD
jgi:pseudouridine-5'-phosphate glycosidase